MRQQPSNPDMTQLILLRHGESDWNRERRFTGWADVGLTDHGIWQMRHAARVLHEAGIEFDVVFSSVLVRCIRSAWLLLEALQCEWIPLVSDWRLNERHYGALTGRSKDEASATFGPEAVQAWRRSFEVAPMPLDECSSRRILADRRYAGIALHELPRAESLRQAAHRAGQAWHELIAPRLCRGQRVLILGHGNVLRTLVMRLECLTTEAVMHTDIGNATPWVYALDEALQPVDKRILSAPPGTTAPIL